MNSLVVPSSPGRQLGQRLIDGNNDLGIRSVLTHSPLSLTALEENVVRFTGINSIAVQRAIDQTILEQPRVSIINHTPVGNGGSNPGLCSTVPDAGREDGVAEFKGPAVHGLVRFAEVNDQETNIEAEFDGLTPGRVYRCSVNEYGDLREGATSTGCTYSPFLVGTLTPAVGEEAAGNLGTVIGDRHGHAEFVGTSSRLAVWDVIGRSVVLYLIPGDQFDSCGIEAVAAAVIARSSVRGTVGVGPDRLCACDGTVVWQSRQTYK